MARTILIVDDNAINRQVLIVGLKNDYSILEAADGKQALDVMHRRHKLLSAVLLDIHMPVMDGYEVLRQMRANPVLAQLPVIVVTGSDDEDARLQALRLGANDFVQKPYNPEIIKHCLRNNIHLRETASIINAIQRDKLTGIYNREFFFERAGEMIQDHEPGFYLLACFDIDNFKLINDQYGAAEGDKILMHIGAEIKKALDKVQGLCGRISGDNFAALYPNQPYVVDQVTRARNASFLPPDAAPGLRFSVGRYIVTDKTLPVSAQYDRAYIAKRSVKGRYDKHTAYFDDSMLRALVMEQEIIGEMDQALANHEFEVWFQPQYNHATGALVGAEALARWRHPVRGLVPPGTFIPIFEENGFVYELDKYVWEETCRYLRQWMDQGRDPLPVSVNVSRYDLFRDDLIPVLTGLLTQYRLPVELLRLEITESAFSETSEPIITTVKRFIDRGFTLEIDDFGSGYSSLNTLKDVPAQVLKLDMRFLENEGSAQRGGSILESIVRMSRWLGMTVIAEGVETVEQADFLKSVGCNYMQGFLYARPMPAKAYEKLAKTVAREERPISLETVETLDSDSFWNPNSMDTLIFNSFVGGACVFESHNGEVELLRVNENYFRELGIQCPPDAPLSLLDPFRYADDEGRRVLHACAERAVATAEEQSGEMELSDEGAFFPKPQYIRYALRVIARAGDRYLFYCVINNITAQRLAERKERESELSRLVAANQLESILISLDGGVPAAAGAGRETQPGVRKRSPGLRELSTKGSRPWDGRISTGAFLYVLLAFCVLAGAALLLSYAGDASVKLDSFSETVAALPEGWTLTDGAGAAQSVQLPLTIPYGASGQYTLTASLPESREFIAAPALCFYSNYVNLRVELEGALLYEYPAGDGQARKATGNTYHFIRLPMDYPGKTVTLRLDCQLGDRITYLLKPPLLGSKGTMLRMAVMESLPSVMLSGCMVVLALVLGALHLFLRRRLRLNSATAYTAVFALLFAVYVFCETSFAQYLAADGTVLFSCTLMLLALLPVPLMGLFAEEVSSRLERVPKWLMLLCALNFAVQFALNYLNVLSFRAMLPATHGVIIVSISVMVACMLCSNRTEKPGVRRKLLSAIPMILGGLADIILLALDKPSFNNSLWFTLGVTSFIIIQFCGFVRGFFVMYRASLEASVLRDMAYRDVLTNIGNRNAYERKLKELAGETLDERLSCIVLDINDLKQINDRYGHSTGDAAIVETSRILTELAPDCASCFRTGGDEFVILLEGYGEKPTEELADKLAREAQRRGSLSATPLSLAIGVGVYQPEDGSLSDFIRRVDSLMYSRKRALKASAAYPYQSDGTDIPDAKKPLPSH